MGSVLWLPLPHLTQAGEMGKRLVKLTILRIRLPKGLTQKCIQLPGNFQFSYYNDLMPQFRYKLPFSLLVLFSFVSIPILTTLVLVCLYMCGFIIIHLKGLWNINYTDIKVNRIISFHAYIYNPISSKEEWIGFLKHRELLLVDSSLPSLFSYFGQRNRIKYVKTRSTDGNATD